jgi:ribonuclease HI
MTIDLYSDGSFFFGRRPAFGWLAVLGKRILAHGSGECRDDGMRNVAGEICGGLNALRYAVEAGFTVVRLHSDLSTLGHHFRKPHPKPGSHSEEAARFLADHKEVQVQFVFRRDTDPFVRRAHCLSRASSTQASAKCAA